MLNDLSVYLGYTMAFVWVVYVLADFVDLWEFGACFRQAPRSILARCGCGWQTPFDRQLAGRFGRCGHCLALIQVTEGPQWGSAA